MPETLLRYDVQSDFPVVWRALLHGNRLPVSSELSQTTARHR